MQQQQSWLDNPFLPKSWQELENITNATITTFVVTTTTTTTTTASVTERETSSSTTEVFKEEPTPVNLESTKETIPEIEKEEEKTPPSKESLFQLLKTSISQNVFKPVLDTLSRRLPPPRSKVELFDLNSFPDAQKIPDKGSLSERFNFASFDCAASIIASNSEASGASSILINSKDQYMLNICKAKKKFLIIELCEDILVDTVMLGNFEFFSSMFKDFRISVTDWYPPKSGSGWRSLGVYRARNSRELQKFSIPNPVIWARYMRLDFLTHYGHEFYCPISSIKVYGVTMMEDLKNEEVITNEQVDQPSKEEKAKVNNNTSPALSNMGKAIRHPISLIPRPIKRPAAMDINKKQKSLVHDLPLLSSPKLGSHHDKELVTSHVEATRKLEKDEEGRETTSTTTTTTSQSTSKILQSIPTINFAPFSFANTREGEKFTQLPLKSGGGGGGGGGGSLPVANMATTQESIFKSITKRLSFLEQNFNQSYSVMQHQGTVLMSNMEGIAQELELLKHTMETLTDSLERQQQQRQVLQHEVGKLQNLVTGMNDELIFEKRMALIQLVLIAIFFSLLFLKTVLRQLPPPKTILRRLSESITVEDRLF